MSIAATTHEFKLKSTGSMILDKDIDIPVRDGTVLKGNLFKPNKTGQFPVLLSLGPYGKDVHLSEFMPGAWEELKKRCPEIFEHSSCTHLVFETAADLAADRGLTGIHLGGGLTDREDDTLWIFKRHVGRLTAHVQFAGIVADPGAHQGLVRRWCEAGGGEPQWFQAYRQPLAGRAGG